jgi:hypothetical protein
MDELHMKKLILLSLIFLGCEKEPEPVFQEKFCYDCILEQKNAVGYYSMSIDFCNMTEEQMNEIIELNTWQSAGGSYYTSLKCTKR